MSTRPQPETSPDEGFDDAPAMPAQAMVQVEYRDLNGNLLSSTQAMCMAGFDNTVMAMPVEGYTALEPTVINVSVDANGAATPDPGIFY